MQWLSQLCEVKDKFVIEPAHITIISEVLEMIRKESLPSQRTLSYVHLQISPKSPVLAKQLEPFTKNTGQGLQNHIFDSEQNLLNLGTFTTFELSMLVRQGNAVLIPTILYLFHMIERSLDGSPVSIYLHDGWSIFKHPVFRDYLDDWLRKIADQNVQIIISVAQPADITKSEIAGILMQSCATKIYTANLNAKGNQRSSYTELGLNGTQIELISMAMVNRDFYFTNQLGSRLIQFQMGELAKVFLTPPSLDKMESIRELKKNHGDLFGYEWIKHNGLIPEMAEFWLDTYNKLTTDIKR